MIRDLQQRVFEILNKKAAPTKKLTLSTRKVLKDLKDWNEKRLFNKMTPPEKVNYIRKLFKNEV